VEQQSMLNVVSLKDHEISSTIFEQVSVIGNHYNTVAHQTDKEELIAVIMEAAPKQYVPVITSEQRARGNLFEPK
jgi:hypothetical protein